MVTKFMQAPNLKRLVFLTWLANRLRVLKELSRLICMIAAMQIGATMGSFPVMAAFGRSSINDATGAKTQVVSRFFSLWLPFVQLRLAVLYAQLSGIVSAITVLLILLFVTPILKFIPSAALAAVVCIAVARLIDIDAARTLFASDRRDFVILLAAFIATLFLGVLVSLWYFFFTILRLND